MGFCTPWLLPWPGQVKSLLYPSPQNPCPTHPHTVCCWIRATNTVWIVTINTVAAVAATVYQAPARYQALCQPCCASISFDLVHTQPYGKMGLEMLNYLPINTQLVSGELEFQPRCFSFQFFKPSLPANLRET